MLFWRGFDLAGSAKLACCVLNVRFSQKRVSREPAQSKPLFSGRADALDEGFCVGPLTETTVFLKNAFF